jgi:ribosomal protein S18 acetylase RimI-like enzyme
VIDQHVLIRPAQPDEAEVVLSVLNSAAAWLVERGIDGWRPGQFRVERIAASIARHEAQLMFTDDRAVATVTLEWSDELMWPGAPDDAGYVHRLAVARAEHGRGLGRMLLSWAESQVALRPRPYVRLDCGCTNPALRHYYERAGYQHRRDRTIQGRGDEVYCASLYEKAAPAQVRSSA